ncbi:MAG: hypothetical protein MUP14_02415 [Dehalococcoidia bacterium]|nr:hypothetical protein [Dehalococcoidia bacterium]
MWRWFINQLKRAYYKFRGRPFIPLSDLRAATAVAVLIAGGYGEADLPRVLPGVKVNFEGAFEAFNHLSPRDFKAFQRYYARVSATHPPPWTLDEVLIAAVGKGKAGRHLLTNA